MRLVDALVSNGSAADKQAAKGIVAEMSSDADEIMARGGSLCEIEDLIYEYGLEPDYIQDIIL